jgi:hypothetical protein
MQRLKIAFTVIVLVAVSTLSGCSVIGGKSEAYKLGVETGQGYSSLKDTADLIDSYIPDETDPESSVDLNISEEDLKKYCSGLWIITGITNGIKNSAENKADYVAGCLDGAGF